jgi:hypothetical protein
MSLTLGLNSDSALSLQSADRILHSIIKSEFASANFDSVFIPATYSILEVIPKNTCAQ